MSEVTLEQLRAYEAKLIRALGDPTVETFYDQFKRRSRPVSELQQQLTWVRSEIARLAPPEEAATPRPRRFLTRHRDAL